MRRPPPRQPLPFSPSRALHAPLYVRRHNPAQMLIAEIESVQTIQPDDTQRASHRVASQSFVYRVINVIPTEPTPVKSFDVSRWSTSERDYRQASIR